MSQTTPFLTDAERRALGLAGHNVLASEAIGPPGVTAAEGASAKDVAFFTFMALGATLPQRLELSVSRAAEDPSWVRVVASSGQEVEPTVPEGQEQTVSRDLEDPSTVHINLGSARVVRIQDAEGRCLVLKLMPEGGIALEEYGVQAAPWALAAVPAPEKWWQEAGDSWMHRTADYQLARGSSIGNAIAAGLFARLLETPLTGAPTILAELRAGRPDRAYSAPRAWARSLTSEQLASLEELALTHADRWHSRLEAAAASPAPEETSWQEEVLAVCHGRDDLECLHFVLSEAGTGQRLGTAVQAMDRDGEALMRQWHQGVVLDDQRLERVAAGDPSAWWARVVQST